MAPIADSKGSKDATEAAANSGSTSLVRKKSLIPRPSSGKISSVQQQQQQKSINASDSYDILQQSSASSFRAMSISSAEYEPSPPKREMTAGSQKFKRDRIRTPGKLRNFFDEAKKTPKKASDNSSIPQLYKEMVVSAQSLSKSSSGIGSDFMVSARSSRVNSISSTPSTTLKQSAPLTILNGSTSASNQIGSPKTMPRTKARSSSFSSSLSQSQMQHDKVIQQSIQKLQKESQPKNGPNMDAFSASKAMGSFPKIIKQQPAEKQQSRNKSATAYTQPKIKILPQSSSFDSTKQLNKSSAGLKKSTSVRKQKPKDVGSDNADPQSLFSSTEQLTTAPAISAPSTKDKLPGQNNAPVPTEDAKPVERPPTPDGMKRCEFCERTFNLDRIEKHQGACTSSPSKKQRKVMDGKTLRTKNTEFEKNVKRMAKQPQQSVPKKKKADWRKQHEDFINAIRAAKSQSS
ncbi:hypothetical protein MP228_008151 [Amoeboaphelidium protococcarum]|nr:hypothetical protein MP228_008151 [Amoeboaphelidium protococcarum]